MRVLTEALKGSPNLTKLCLSRACSVVCALSFFLRVCALSLTLCAVTTLPHAGNQMGDAGNAAVLELAASAPTLTHVEVKCECRVCHAVLLLFPADANGSQGGHVVQAVG